MTTKPIEFHINAAARIIGDISTGIYRSPANALKELVSNSFDAGATEVLINTAHPGFSTLSCFDNGPGISTQELKTISASLEGVISDFVANVVVMAGRSLEGLALVSWLCPRLPNAS